ncbi:hypothetical protein [Gandjariella thermophila]|uniref:hypothetical protein n=1 Tax=Gandjariella thermophila TaxID=1931992 RepID=UPI00129B3116|nr:hypothetical protein [Gandjariella thermophila]
MLSGCATAHALRSSTLGRAATNGTPRQVGRLPASHGRRRNDGPAGRASMVRFA